MAYKNAVPRFKEINPSELIDEEAASANSENSKYLFPALSGHKLSAIFSTRKKNEMSFHMNAHKQYRLSDIKTNESQGIQELDYETEPEGEESHLQVDNDRGEIEEKKKSVNFYMNQKTEREEESQMSIIFYIIHRGSFLTFSLSL